MALKLKKDYFVPGVQHVCMFCETPIGILVDGRIKPLANKTHVLLEKTSPGLYIINCCADCARDVDFNNQKNLNDIHKNILDCREKLDLANGLSPDDVAKSRALHNSEKPKKGFMRVERSVIDRKKNLKDYQEHNKNAR